MSSHAANSTTVRSYYGRRARSVLGALQSIAPPLAARVAARAFMTPPRYRKAPPDWATIARAAPFALDAGGETLRGVRLGRGPAVLLVHGWGGRADQLAAFAPPLLEAGCSVIAFDGPAHGASTGRTTSMPEMADAVRQVGVRFRARAAIAHSVGGAAIALALHRGLPLESVVLVAPPRTPAAFLDAFCASLGLTAETREALRLRIERRVGIRMSELTVPRFAGGLRTPALVVHDRTDAEVPWDDGAAIAAAWPGARLVSTDALGHRRILRDQVVVSEAASFVIDRLPRCGCGRLGSCVQDDTPRCETCLLALHLKDREGRTVHATA
jgi:pimeloyl-ACP methyl ester carboxylesterase